MLSNVSDVLIEAAAAASIKTSLTLPTLLSRSARSFTPFTPHIKLG